MNIYDDPNLGVFEPGAQVDVEVTKSVGRYLQFSGVVIKSNLVYSVILSTSNTEKVHIIDNKNIKRKRRDSTEKNVFYKRLQ